MMGGLNSMVQIGFAMVALCNFTSHAWKGLKAIISFLVKTSKSMALKFIGLFKVTSQMTDAW